jgi:hypothetical protein
MAKRIMDYEPDPDFPTPGLPRIQQLRRLKAQSYMTRGERSELKRLEASQRDMEYDWHRRQRQAAYWRSRNASSSSAPE